MDWKFEIIRCKLLCLEWINKKVWLYSSGNCIQYPMINHTEKEYEKGMHITESLCSITEIGTALQIDYTSIKWKEERKKEKRKEGRKERRKIPVETSKTIGKAERLMQGLIWMFNGERTLCSPYFWIRFWFFPSKIFTSKWEIFHCCASKMLVWTKKAAEMSQREVPCNCDVMSRVEILLPLFFVSRIVVTQTRAGLKLPRKNPIIALFQT